MAASYAAVCANAFLASASRVAAERAPPFASISAMIAS